MIETYAWRGGTEMLLRHGAGSKTSVLILPALFEEANRMRRFTVSVMRALAERGVGSILPDLPGTGESLIALSETSFADWKDAAEAAADLVQPCLTVAIRGGALLDDAGEMGWRLAPESGERLVRDLVRATALSSGRSATEIDRQARAGTTALAGNLISPELYTSLVLAALPGGTRRTARLADDAGPREVSIPGTRLWRSAEPGYDPAFAAATADDIASWAKTCAAH